MDCDFYYSLLSAHIDGENSEAEEAQLQEHLAVCPHCRALLRQWEQTDSLLVQTPAPPADLTVRILKQLPKKRRRRRLLYFAAPAATLAAAAVLALAVFGAMNLPAYAKNCQFEFASGDDAAFSDSDYLLDLTDAPRAYGSETASGKDATDELKANSTMSDNGSLAEVLSVSPVMVVWYPEAQAPFEDLTPVMELPMDEESDTALMGMLSSLLPGSSDLAENITDTLCSAASGITIYLPDYNEMQALLDRCTGQYEVALYYPAGTPESSDSFLLLAVAAP